MENFYLFLMMSIILIILPGPDTAIATKNTLTVGRTGGLQTIFGTCCALLVHTTAAVVGLSTIIVKSALLFTIFKYVGALYLIFLGIKTLLALKNKKATTKEITLQNKYESKSCFKQGFLTNILNPKVAIFFLTFLPQFVNAGSPTLIPFLIMGITYSVLTAIWFLFYVSLLNQISYFMKRPKTQLFMEGITGAVLIGFGVKMAFERAQN